jgi:hypothetical protein
MSDGYEVYGSMAQRYGLVDLGRWTYALDADGCRARSCLWRPLVEPSHHLTSSHHHNLTIR